MLPDQLRQAVVDLFPHLGARHRAELVLRHFDRQFHLAPVADVYDAGRWAQELRHLFDRIQRGGKADALRPPAARPFDQRVQTCQRQRQVGAALIVDHRMDLVHDHRAHRPERPPALLRREQNEERFRRGDQNMRRPIEHPPAFPGRSVARAQRRADRGQIDSLLCRQRRNPRQRDLQVLANIVAQRLERRDVDDSNLVGQRPGPGGADQAIQADQERRQRLAGARGR